MRNKLLKKGVLLVVVLFTLAFMILRSNWFWNSLNPIFHKHYLYKYAGEYRMDPLLIAAIIHVESKFNPVATSRAGALGLMQIKPGTAGEIARELKMDYVNVEELYEPEKNIKMGFYYIRKLYDEFNENLVFSLAAYNAGISKAKEWEKMYAKHSESDIIDNISYAETQQFVKKVIKSYNYFKTIQRFKRLMRMEN